MTVAGSQMEGIALNGKAKSEAKTALLLAPVTPFTLFAALLPVLFT